VAIAFWAAVGLTACSGDDSGARSSGDPTALPQAKPPDQESVKRFIKRWAAAEARMENTGRTARFLAMSRDCPLCHQLAQHISGYYAAGGFIRGGAWRIDSIEVPPRSGGGIIYTVHAHQAPMTFRQSSSRPVQHFHGGPITYLLGVAPTRGSYTVTSMTAS
jgi:hypothetical protein